MTVTTATLCHLEDIAITIVTKENKIPCLTEKGLSSAAKQEKGVTNVTFWHQENIAIIVTKFNKTTC